MEEISINAVRLRRTDSDDFVVSVKVGDTWTDVISVFVENDADEKADAREIRRLIAVHHDY